MISQWSMQNLARNVALLGDVTDVCMTGFRNLMAIVVPLGSGASEYHRRRILALDESIRW